MGQQHPQIAIEAVTQLDAGTEVALLSAAHARDPANALVFSRLVELLLELDRFDEVIALLGPRVETLDFDLCLDLTKACFFKREPDPVKAALALRAAETALILATNAEMRARALCDRGKALLELDREADGAADLREAFQLDRHGLMPFKRHAMLLLRERAFVELEAITAALLGEDVVNPNVLSARVLALAGLGQTEAARELAGFDAYALSEALEVPPGWNDLASFNAQLSAEIRANPGLRFERLGTASQQTWRVDAPARGATPAVHAALRAIAQQAERWIAALPLSGHPWLAARPAELQLNCWSVITEAEGYERWHLHPEGWMSGGYYPEVPAAVSNGTDVAGCFVFGLPAREIGSAAAAQFGEQLVRPYAGMLSLFPSHAQHATHPHGADAQRICLAFDLCPAD
jgi:hypothetical protein